MLGWMVVRIIGLSIIRYKSFVVKILDGHGGTGVMMIDGKKILAALQLIFAIDPERRLIIQKKEEGDGGYRYYYKLYSYDGRYYQIYVEDIEY